MDFVALILLYFLVFYKRWRAKGRDVLLINTLLYIYLTFVLYFTLMPIITSLPFIFDHPHMPMNFAPFVDVAAGRGDYARQVILNVVMTVPFGFLLPLVGHGKINFLKTVSLTFLLSLSIELIQPIISSSRLADITDIITNVLGGIIGYGIFLVFRPLVMKLLKLIKETPKVVT